MKRILSAYAQVRSNIFWSSNNLKFRENDNYVEVIVDGTLYLEEIGNPKIPYCVRSLIYKESL